MTAHVTTRYVCDTCGEPAKDRHDWRGELLSTDGDRLVCYGLQINMKTVHKGHMGPDWIGNEQDAHQCEPCFAKLLRNIASNIDKRNKA